jgi:hypothetical protein
MRDRTTPTALQAGYPSATSTGRRRRRSHERDRVASARHALALLLAALLASTTVACGEDTAAAGDDPDTVAVGAGADAGTIDTTADTAKQDTTSDKDTGDDSAVIDPDSIGPSCPGEAGCPCTSASECDSNYCLETPKGSICAQSCVSECPDGFKCATTSGQGGDVINICVPQWGNLCNPCNANADCLAPGNSDAACVSHGDNGAFCAVACSDDAGCPEGYACEAREDTAGKDVKQCVVKNGGACACSEYAIAKELSTTCAVKAGDAKCSGKRTCLPEGAAGAPPGGGLSACLAPEPEPEKCDGIDNDCDGQSDESTCDDGNPCTIDNCGGGAGCQTTNKEGDCDADDSVCTVQDTCKDGKCLPGKALDCDDQNSCTADKCDPKGGCQYEPLTGPICNADDNECTQSDACKEGVCSPGAKKSCESGDQCWTGNCSVQSGKCTYTFQTGLPCNDGNPCTTGESCANDTCKGDATKCDDGNPCTADACETPKGCVHKPTAGPCTDGNACTKQDTCTDGSCVGLALSATADCDDGNACTKDACNPAVGCTHADQTGTPCSDGSTCTSNDVCAAGKCQPGTNVCDCKTDTDCESKEDGNLCNGTLFCDTQAAPFKCKIKPSSVITCDKSINSACQTNACDPQSGGCKLSFAPKGVACDKDDNVCTQNDSCDGDGACVAGAVVKCDDGNGCTNDACDAKNGCTYTANSAPCNADDNACTVGDVCKEGSCLPGDTKKCDDNEPCTADSCDKQSAACLFSEVSTTCDDGNACTDGDACGKNAAGKYTCLSGDKVVCNDGNACTFDSCDEKKGCVSAPVADGVPCDDGNACTAKDVCGSGSCAGSPIVVAKDCDDSNDCTADTCDSKTGCVHQPISGKSCSDGDDCSVGDTCNSGKCEGGTNICACQNDNDCAKQEDGNLCNGTLFCDKAQAPYTCKVNPITVVKCDDSQDNFCAKNTCDPSTGKCAVDKKADDTQCNADDSVCTTNDACKAGKCEPGKPLPCDDLNPCTANSCDAKTGCTAVEQSGPCDADGDPCTVDDVCTGGKCVAGKAVDCNDNEPCTAEACDKKTGKCSYTELVQGCDDKKVCTVGDACGKNASGSWTCLPGKPMACEDNNVCTDDACAEPDGSDKGGCKYAIADGKKVPCYTGPSGTSGKGICKDGNQICDAKGNLGVCGGDVTPEKVEACDGKDNTCDGITDEGCAPTGFLYRDGNASVRSEGKTHGVDAALGTSAVGGSAAAGQGGKVSARFGFVQWLRALLGK